MRVDHRIGASIHVSQDNGSPLLTYDYGSAPKPFIHPLHTAAGHPMTVWQPRDHFWHRGLWFTIKFVNGLNFWEESDPFGSQVCVRPPSISIGAGGEVEILSVSEWRHPGEADPPLRERRVVTVHPPNGSAYAIDFETILTASIDVKLNRTPYTTWGGYGGLALRGHRGWQETRILLADGTVTDRPTGQAARWAQMAGVLDGGPDLAAGIALLGHPSNPRHPSPWYGSTGYDPFLNAAFLFHEPMPLAAGEPLALRYRVLVHDGERTSEEIEQSYAEYAK